MIILTGGRCYDDDNVSHCIGTAFVSQQNSMRFTHRWEAHQVLSQVPDTNLARQTLSVVDRNLLGTLVVYRIKNLNAQN